MLHVLITGSDAPDSSDSIVFYDLLSLKNKEAQELIVKYSYDDNLLRWALKPVLLQHILRDHDSVIYVDNDIFFFSSFDFIFNQLKHHSLLLTPHWGNYAPLPYEEAFLNNFQIGLFNAGFVGATQHAKDLLAWWTSCCIYNMSRDLEKGLFDDQRYLDLCMIMDHKVGILRHLGCNIGSWNIHQNIRKIVDSTVLINGSFPIVFIHFNTETIKHINNGNDSFLNNYLSKYNGICSLFHAHVGNAKTGIQKRNMARKVLRSLGHKLLIRTRLKLLLMKLATKL